MVEDPNHNIYCNCNSFLSPNSNPSEGVVVEGAGLGGLLVVVGEVPPRPTCRPGGGQSHQSQPENTTEEKVSFFDTFMEV